MSNSRQVKADRRGLLVLAAMFGVFRAQSSNAKQPDEPLMEEVSWLPRSDDSGSINVWRLKLGPRRTWSSWQPGRASIMVESGVMTAPAFVQGETVTIVGGPTLPAAGRGTPVSWTSPPFYPPEFTQYFGFVTEDGDFGTIENNGTEDLVVILIVDHPNPT